MQIHYVIHQQNLHFGIFFPFASVSGDSFSGRYVTCDDENSVVRASLARFFLRLLFTKSLVYILQLVNKFKLFFSVREEIHVFVETHLRYLMYM